MPIRDSEIDKLLSQLKREDNAPVATKTEKPKAKKPNRSNKWKDAPSWFFPSKYGEQIADELEVFINMRTPVMCIGGTGLGKTVITDMIARKLGRGSVGFNCYSGMDIASLVGLWLPDGKGEVIWNHGIVTNAIIKGFVLRIEEWTRCTPELKSKMFGIMDSKDRYWALPEAKIDKVDVHENFTIVASANPAGKGYVGTMREDKATMSRFGAVIEINEPLADEKKAMLNATDGNDDLSNRIVRFAELCRQDGLTYVSTRDIYYLATAITSGMDAKRAVEVKVAPKFDGMESAIITHGRSVFEDMGKETCSDKVSSVLKGKTEDA